MSAHRLRCPVHQAEGFPCEQYGCALLAEAQLLEDRLAAIEWLVREARECLLDNCSEMAEGLSIPAALEAARVLARSITAENPDSRHERMTQPTVRWRVVRGKSEEPKRPSPRPVS